MNEIRTITLDLDDTLWAIHPVIRRAEQRLYAWLGEHCPRITEMYQPADLCDLQAQLVTELAEYSHDLTFLRRTALERIGAAAGYPMDFVDAAFDVFDTARNEVEIFPEVLPTLEVLRDNVVLIAVTNGNAKLDAIGIDHFFSHVVTAAMAGAAKPARQVFDLAVQAGGASARQTLHVGDHPLYDVDGARGAGLHTAWVNRTASTWPNEFAAPDFEITHVGELPGLLGIV